MSGTDLHGLDDDPLLDKWVDLPSSETGVLLSIAQINTAGGRAWGQDIVDRTEERFGITARHGFRMLANLSEMEAINSEPIDDKTSRYELSDKGWAMVEAAHNELGDLLDERGE